jgi:hypothetical protein
MQGPRAGQGQATAAQAALALLATHHKSAMGYGCLGHSLTGPAMHDTWDKGCVPSFGLVKRLLLHAIVESAFLLTCHCCSNASCLYIQLYNQPSSWQDFRFLHLMYLLYLVWF